MKRTIEKTNCFAYKFGTLFDLLKFGTLKLLSDKAALTSSRKQVKFWHLLYFDIYVLIYKNLLAHKQ